MTPALSCDSFKHRENKDFVIKNKLIFNSSDYNSCFKYSNGYACQNTNSEIELLNEEFAYELTVANVDKKYTSNLYFIQNDSLYNLNYRPGFSGSTSDYYYLNDKLAWEYIAKPQIETPTLYEDDTYSVSACCEGEFGGSLFFKHIESNKLYSCPATCPVSVVFMNESFIVTNSLAHGTGSTEIIEVKAPSSLYELTTDSPVNECNWWYDSEYERDLKPIFDSIGLFTMHGFKKSNKLYTINSTFNQTWLSVLNTNKIFKSTELLPAASWSYNPEVQKTNNGFFYYFKNPYNSGFIEMRGDTILGVVIK